MTQLPAITIVPHASNPCLCRNVPTQAAPTVTNFVKRQAWHSTQSSMATLSFTLRVSQTLQTERSVHSLHKVAQPEPTRTHTAYLCPGWPLVLSEVF